MPSANGHNGAAPISLYSQDAEESVLGSILIDPPAIHEVSDALRPRHFKRPETRAVYKAILSLERAGVDVDFVTLAEALNREGSKPNGGHWESYLVSLLNAVPTSVNVASYARIVSDYGKRRELLSAAQQIAALSGDTDRPASELLSQATELVLGVQQENDTGGVLHPRQYMRRFLDDQEEGTEGEVLATPIIKWNEILLGGLRAPFAHFIAARPKMGKSALCMHLVGHAAVHLKKRIYFATTEMSDLQFSRRVIAQQTGIPMARLMKRNLRDGEMEQVYDAAGVMERRGPHLDVSAGLTPSQVRARAMRIAGRHGLDLIVVDHLHEMAPDRSINSRHLELGEMARSLRDTAKALDVPIIIVAQLNRGVESRSSKTPQLADFREAGALEETAYSVTFVHRDNYYDETVDPEKAQLIVAAHRDGPTGKVDVKWNAPLMRFENPTQEYQSPMVPGRSDNGEREPEPIDL